MTSDPFEMSEETVGESGQEATDPCVPEGLAAPADLPVAKGSEALAGAAEPPEPLDVDGPGLDLTAALAEALVAIDTRSEPPPRPPTTASEYSLPAMPAEAAPVIRGGIPRGPNTRNVMDFYAIQRTADALQIALDRALDDASQARADLSAARRRFLKLSDDHDALRAGAVRNEGEVRAAGMRRALEAILPALDALDAMVEHLEKRETLSATGQEGIEMLRLEWQRTLSSLGVQPFEADGVFDPAMHEAIASQIDASGPPGRVLRQLSRGYSLGGKVLRCARVVVSKEPPELARPEETAEDL